MDANDVQILLNAINGVNKRLDDMTQEQVEQGKQLATVCTKVKNHSYIHRITLAGVFGALGMWFKQKFQL